MGLLSLNSDTARMCCGECGVEFFVPSWFCRDRKENGKTWYCPNGHPRVFSETESAKLKKRLEIETKKREWAEQAEKKARHAESVARGKLRAQSERVAHGVCPCCKRTFKQLSRHMKAKHPEFVKGSRGK